MTTAAARSSLILVVAPTGRDGPLAVQALMRAGLLAQTCASIDELCALAPSSAAVLLAEEALSTRAMNQLTAMLHRQPGWSDLPVVIFTSAHATPDGDLKLARIREVLGNVTFLERPMRTVTLMSSLQSALRARQRQYDLRETLEKQVEEVRQRDQFLAMLGHELRNPLASIIMAGDLMDRAGSDAFARQRALIKRQARHLGRLVDDLLDVARVTTGKIVLRRSAVDLFEIAQRGVQAAEPTIKAHHQEVAIKGSPGVIVDGDPVRIEQVVSNLLANALKYTPSGGSITVEVSAQGTMGELRVRDTGVGIAPEILPKVFDLFTQAAHTLDRSQGGLGIGLTVVKALVQLHRGNVSVASAGEGFGTEVLVALPLYQANEEHEEAAAGTALPVNVPRHVVVIEDHDDSREVLESLLKDMGHRVEVAADGQSGLTLLLHEHPDIAFVDIGLPALDGYGLARQARMMLGNSVYLVALTGYGQSEDRQRAHDAGFDLHLTKPLHVQELQGVLESRYRAAAH